MVKAVSNQEELFIKSSIEKLDKQYTQQFLDVYQSWKNNCRKQFPFLSNTYTCKKAEKYNELIEMGNQSTPLYIQKLIDQDFWSLVPYTAIQNNKNYLLAHKFLHESEQFKGMLHVKLWLNNEYFHYDYYPIESVGSVEGSINDID